MEPHIEVCCHPGVPNPVGHLGTIIVDRVLPDGRVQLRFFLAKRIADRCVRKGKRVRRKP